MEASVKAEVRKIVQGTVLGTAGMFVLFLIGHIAVPDLIALNYQVFLGGIVGAAVAIGNFVGLAMTVQKIADHPDPEEAKKRMKVSYSRRMLMQGAWVIAAVVLPCFQWAAGVIPLLFPRAVISLSQIGKRNNPKNKGGEG